jgi:hypothetical protein
MSGGTERAGKQAGDVLLAIDDHPESSVAQVRAATSAAQRSPAQAGVPSIGTRILLAHLR